MSQLLPVLTRNRTAYVTKEAAVGTFVAPANANAFRFVDMKLTAAQPVEVRPDVNPSLSRPLGTAMRKSASWTMSCSLAGSGVAGTAPDIGPFLETGIGAAVPTTGVVTYNPADVAATLDLWGYAKDSAGNQPAGLTQQAALAASVSQIKFNLGQNFATADFSGEAWWVLDTDQFATADATAKGSLVSFPTEPSAPVLNGAAVQGFVGSITVDSVTYTGIIRSANVTYSMVREYPKDVFGIFYPGAPIPGYRDVTVDFNLYDDDGSSLSALKTKIFANTTFNAVIAIGLTAGNIWTFNLNNLQVPTKPAYDNSATKRALSFTAQAHQSTATAKDEFSLVLT